MSFYDEWEKKFDNGEDDAEYVDSFLNKEETSCVELEEGDKEDIANICKFLLRVPINHFIKRINNKREFLARDIIQYSNFNDVIVRTPAVLELKNEELTYRDLGKELINAKTDAACTKYGENHSKTAQEFSLVSISNNRPATVKNTNFGSFCVYIDEYNRKELIKRLAIRNPFIYTLIYYAKNNYVRYMDYAKTCLTTVTAIRRKSNVKYVVELILEKTDIFEYIDWSDNEF